MDFVHSDKVKALQDKISTFMEAEIYPNEKRHEQEIRTGDRWQPTALMEELKAKARGHGLWNLFLTHSKHGPGLTNLEYAPLCEIMGRSAIAPEAFNCSAPDTGNMETLDLCGSAEQKAAPACPTNSDWPRPMPRPARFASSMGRTRSTATRSAGWSSRDTTSGGTRAPRLPKGRHSAMPCRRCDGN